MWRLHADSPFTVGAAGTPRIVVCLAGDGRLEYEGTHYAVAKGDTMLLPAVVGACVFQPRGGVTLLEISLPEGK